MFAHDPAEAAAEGEPRDAGVADDAAGGGQTVGLCLVVDVAPQGTTLHPGGTAGEVDPHGPHRREVDDDSVVADRGASHVVAPATHRDLHVVVTGEADGRSHIGASAASGDQPGAPVNGAVPNGSGDVVVPMVSCDQFPSEPVDLHHVAPRLMASSHHRGPRLRSPVLHTRTQKRDTRVVRTYGQYCPIARGAEIFAERWTPLIIRNLYLGCGSFGEILEGAPGLSRTLLSQRLKQLERLAIVESAPKPDGRGRNYVLTPAGQDLFKVCGSLGEWGARWLQMSTSIPSWLMVDVQRPPDSRIDES